MAQLIKVIQLKKKGGFGDNYDDYATFKELLPSLFGKPIELNGWKYEGVEIKTLRSNPDSWYGHRLLGVQLTVGEYRNRTFRRVMIKNDFIDVEDFQKKFNEMKEVAKSNEEWRKKAQASQNEAEALRDRIVEDFQKKFNEMKEVAKSNEEWRKKAQASQNEAEALRDRIAKEVNHNPKDLYPYPISLRTFNTESVRIDAKVSGEQLSAVEKIMGKQQLELEIIVPADKAVEVYKIMFDNSELKGEE